MRKLITILILTLAAISCGKIKDTHNTLNDIETFINERPDSALTILDSFDTSLLENKSVWAHHSLLHAQAKDKCYIDETNDSLMTQVVNYYEGKRDKEKLFKAYYYLGRIQHNAGNYTESMLSYTRAEQLTNEIEDDFSKGLLYAQLGMLHLEYYDYDRSLEAYTYALGNYILSNKVTHQYYTKLNIGHVYHEQKLYSQAEEMYKHVLEWAYDNNIDYLCVEAIEFLITLYDETDRTQLGIELLNSKYGARCPESLYTIRAKAYEAALLGNKQANEIIENNAWMLSKTITDTINNYYYQYRIHKLLGNYKEASVIYENIYHIQDTLTVAAYKRPLLTTKNSYLQAENDYMQLVLRSNRAILAFIVFITLSVIIGLCILFKRRLDLKQTEIIRYVEIAKDLEHTLISKTIEVEKISKEMGVLDNELRNSSNEIASMMRKQYELLNKLTNTYYETHVCNKDKEAIYKQVSTEIKRLGSDHKAIQQLEALVNRYQSNIMQVIRHNLPNMNDIDYVILCYLCVGFSAKAISIFTGVTTNYIYVKKSRIKVEVMKLSPEIRDLILTAICSQ